MNRASPAELRKALEVAQLFAKAGIPFVCVPYTSDHERDLLVMRVNDTLHEASKEKSNG